VQSDARTRAKGPEHIAAYNWMQDYAARVIALRRANPCNDLISNFALAEIDGDRLDDREVLLTTTTLIMAGVESLGGFMMMFAYNLASLPDPRRAVVANPDLLPDAIEESLRFNTSAQRFRRRLMKDVTLYGQTMREGDFVCLAYGSGNRDERRTPTQTPLTSVASRAVTSVLAVACMPAWAPPLRGWRSKLRSMSSTKWCPSTTAWPSNCHGCRRAPSAARWCWNWPSDRPLAHPLRRPDPAARFYFWRPLLWPTSLTSNRPATAPPSISPMAGT